ncbi:hypothetical protein AKJ16_DCAP25588, partial [Drosera capensis]
SRIRAYQENIALESRKGNGSKRIDMGTRNLELQARLILVFPTMTLRSLLVETRDCLKASLGLKFRAFEFTTQWPRLIPVVDDLSTG